MFYLAEKHIRWLSMLWSYRFTTTWWRLENVPWWRVCYTESELVKYRRNLRTSLVTAQKKNFYQETRISQRLDLFHFAPPENVTNLTCSRGKLSNSVTPFKIFTLMTNTTNSVVACDVNVAVMWIHFHFTFYNILMLTLAESLINSICSLRMSDQSCHLLRKV